MLTLQQLENKPRKLTLECEAAERSRLQQLTIYERHARQQGYSCVAGVDEAGRGPLAGPVVAAACIIPEEYFICGINDSKQLTALERAQLFEYLINEPTVRFGIGIIEADEIDRVNIYQATILAMLQAIENLSDQPDYLLIDGMALKTCPIPHEKIIKGDAKSQSIAAASVIAKETRDRLMFDYDRQWPEYGFAKHKGYGTKFHREALLKHGPCKIHRKTFGSVAESVAESVLIPS